MIARRWCVDGQIWVRHGEAVSTLAEIERAAEALPADQKQELMLFLAARLRADGARLPEPRRFSPEQVEAWIAEDEAELRRLLPEG